jgi:glyoxylase-like metal-dependent hydrolase (beta-lactamase superfamily II)
VSQADPGLKVLQFIGDRAFEENMYLVFDSATRQAIIIDPGARNEALEAEVRKRGLRIDAIYNTHGHHDHTGANNFYRARYKADVYASPRDSDRYEDPADAPTRPLPSGDELRLGDLKVRVIGTPGHTPGSACFMIGDVLFTGDTLFRGAVGRTDDDVSAATMLREIENGLLVLPPDTAVYPGHGEATTIAEEKEGNPFLQSAR